MEFYTPSYNLENGKLGPSTAAWLAQLGERWSAEWKVTGSNPGWTNPQGL